MFFFKTFYVKLIIFRLFYKSKSIEISCPIVPKQMSAFLNDDQSNQKLEMDLDSTEDYLISDTPTGRYYTCYSLDRRNVI